MDKEKIIKLINAYWRFDNEQDHISTWHDKQDLISAIEQLTIPVVVNSANELTEEFKEYTEKLLQSKKDTTDFLMRAGIIDSNGDLTEHYK